MVSEYRTPATALASGAAQLARPLGGVVTRRAAPTRSADRRCASAISPADDLQHLHGGLGLFRDAKLPDLIAQSPAILDERQLGPLVDKDPAWRNAAVFASALLVE
jgi:hypothetical protein